MLMFSDKISILREREIPPRRPGAPRVLFPENLRSLGWRHFNPSARNRKDQTHFVEQTHTLTWDEQAKTEYKPSLHYIITN